MGRGTKSVEVGGNGFRIRRLPPFDALELFGDLQARLFAPLLAVLDGTPAGEGGKFAAQLAGGVERVLRGLDGKRMRELANQLLQPEYVFIVAEGGQDGEKLTPAVATKYGLTTGDLVELCVEVVRHNYEDFWMRAADRFGPALSRLANRLDASGTISNESY